MVTFYTRNGCALCAEGLHLVDAEVKRRRLDLSVIDVDDTPDLAETYGSRVPVVVGPDQTVIAEGRIDRGQLRRALKKI